MTSRQYGTLRYFVDHETTVDGLGKFNLTTLGSLIHRGWVQRKDSRIVITDKGVEAWQMYHRSGPVYREHEGPVSERVRLMLHLSLRLMKAS